MTEQLHTEIASEHHDRIEHVEEQLTEIREELHDTEQQLEADVQVAAAVVPPHEHPEYSPLEHLHPEYVTHGELDSRLAHAESDIEDAPEQAADAVEEIPIPEPEPEPEYEYIREHGRMRRREKA